MENFLYISLGKTGICVSPLGLGCWQWGDQLVWEYGKAYRDEDVTNAFKVSVEAGINFFDTAEVYGMGRSETLLGQQVRSQSQDTLPALVATKFMPFPWRLGKFQLKNALKNSLDRLGLPKVDLYQVHFPLPPMPVAVWANGLADVVEAGLTRAVGVSNFDLKQMNTTLRVLTERGVPLASNQVEFSLVNRKPETNGLLERCKEAGVTLIAYSPLGKGLLSGKYTPANRPSGTRSRMVNTAFMERLQPLVALQREIGQLHGGKTPAQVALNWAICKGALVIPGAKNAHQAQENAGALGWRLDDAEVDALDKASMNVQL